MFSFRISLPVLLVVSFATGNAQSREHAVVHGIVHLKKIPSEQWVEKVWSDTEKPGALFVIRIHNDAGVHRSSAHSSDGRQHYRCAR
jgi:hypothetical protein